MENFKLYGSNQTETHILVRTVVIVTKDITTKFGIDRCGILAMKKGREVECDEKELENAKEIGQVGVSARRV